MPFKKRPENEHMRVFTKPFVFTRKKALHSKSVQKMDALEVLV
jgi:hypothetical protein